MPLSVLPKPHWTELTLSQPPRNVLDVNMLTALVTALDRLWESAPPLLLRAEGKHFSTGYPISDIAPEIFDADPAVRAGTPFEQVMDRLSRYPAPILAAVQGDAYGGAVELLTCADLRVAAGGVRVGVPAVRLGLVYSHTGMRRLLCGFGSALAREMLLLGEPIGSERAAQAGFFNRVVAPTDLLPTAREMMAGLTRGGPAALRGTRLVLKLLADKETLSEEELTTIAAVRHASRSGTEFAAAQAAFLAKKGSPFGG